MALDKDSFLAKTVVEVVVAEEVNDNRFESLCCGVVSFSEGGALVMPTSRSWDQARDGVGVGIARGVYVCASLRDDIDAKALSDVERIIETTSGIERLFFCSSHRLSEYKSDQLAAQLTQEFDAAFPVTCYGGQQIAEISLAEGNLLQKLYGAEISSALKTIRDEPTDENERKGLRLALISGVGDDSIAIRRSVYEVAMLDVLKDNRPRTMAVCSKDVAHSMRLARSLAEETIRPHLQSLAEQGLLSTDGTTYVITEAGLSDLDKRVAGGVERLVAGKAAIRRTLERSISSALIDEDFARIWNVFEEKMTEYFVARGDQIVAEVAALLEEGPTVGVKRGPSPLSFLEQLANAVAGTARFSDRQNDLRQAVMDLFVDTTSEATGWLVRVSASFVTACALGLEHSRNAALENVFRRVVLVLDTDVVLSLLGEGESEHAAVEAIVKRWRRFRGQLLVGEPVLEEVARHAYIAQRDFDEVLHLLPGDREDRLHIIENVFVRSFAELMERGEAKSRRDWVSFVNGYRGTTEYDWHVVFDVLNADFGIEKLPPRSLREAPLEKAVREFLVAQAQKTPLKGSSSRYAEDKARRDAQLYSAMVNHVRALRVNDPGVSCILLSSAKRLAAAEENFHEAGEPQMVLSIAAVLYLVSMLPDVSLGLSAMKAFLFDERRGRFTSDLERTLLRVIKNSREISMPYARRGSLLRAVHQQVLKDAQERGESPRKAVAEFSNAGFLPANQEHSLELVSKALDSIAVDKRLEKENANLRGKVKELESKLEQQAAKGNARNAKKG